MTEMILYCPDCCLDTLFEQHHPDVGSCPDSPDGYCPEWCCTPCGAALLTGFTPAFADLPAEPVRRVA
jgi:hypothetical protein